MHLPGLVLFCIGGKDIGDMNANNMLERALACAAKGWLIFPCGEDKRPRIKWSEGATNKELEIRRLWRQFPNALVGVVTGKKSRLYVVDVDNPERLAELGLALSWGRQVSTRRAGGMHYYFCEPLDGKPVRNVTDNGVDFRGDGGMVICWADDPAGIGPLSFLPPSVIEWARQGRNEGQPAGEVPEEILEGNRETELVSLAGTMRRRGCGAEEILALLQVSNSLRCRPPLDDEDLERIAQSVAQYASNDETIERIKDTLRRQNGLV